MPGFGTLLWPMSGASQARMRLEEMPFFAAWDVMRHNVSPYDLNPMKFNPLRDPVGTRVDFERLRAEKNFQVMVCATNVRTARRRVFSNEDISVDAVLASACLPLVFPAIEIDGDPYWDGGYAGNPAMFALLRRMPKCDMIIVRIDPIIRNDLPRTQREINDRITELSFNATFWLELSVAAGLLALVEEGAIDRERFGRFLFHAIEASSEFEKISASTKLNNSMAFLTHLFDLGRMTADAWFARNGDHIGKKSSIDLRKLLPPDWALARDKRQEAAVD
jgi:NTE family protein